MKASRADQVEKAIKKIKKFHELGRRLPSNQGHREVYGKHLLATESSRNGVNEDTLRKARQFADPSDGYSEEQMEALCALIRKYQPDQEEKKPVFGKTHVILLMRVPKRDRKKLVERAVKEAWSTEELRSNIVLNAEKDNPKRARHDRGRRPHIPSDLNGLFIQMGRMCKEWRRWDAELRREQEIEEVKHVEFGELPLALRTELSGVIERLLVLEKKSHSLLLKESSEKSSSGSPRRKTTI